MNLDNVFAKTAAAALIDMILQNDKKDQESFEDDIVEFEAKMAKKYGHKSCFEAGSKEMGIMEITTGLYFEGDQSQRSPLYSTDVQSEFFGGKHKTLENLIREFNIIQPSKGRIPSVSTRGLNGTKRAAKAKRFKITITPID